MSIAQNFPALKPSLLLDFSNTEALDSRVTFTRASTATYYGTQTAKAEENLLLQSQTFETTSWTANGTTITSDTEVAPDGTTTADTLTGNGASSAHVVQPASPISFSALTYTLSVFAKAGTNNFIQLRFFSALGAAFANFDLENGVVGTNGSGASSLIVSVGNGWYRCVMTATTTASASGGFNVWLVTSDSAVSGETNTLSTSVYLWGAQLEQRSAVTAYTVTTTQPITNYIPVLETAASGVARFDHNPTTFESLGLLIEEQRTNLLTYSEQFDNAAWTKSRLTITANTVVAPDGALTGDKLVETTETGVHQVIQGVTCTSGVAYTYSCYVKAAERTAATITMASAAFPTTQMLVNISAKSISTISGTPVASSVSDVGGGWIRVTVTQTATATGNGSGQTGVYNGTTNYTGDGYSGIYIWGAQLEAGAFATSYIPTVASQVTRSADAASMTGTDFSSWYNQAQGSLYADYTLNSQAISRAVLDLNDSAATNTNSINVRYASGGQAQLQVVVGAAVQVSLAPSGFNTSGASYKRMIAYATNSFNQAINGALPTAEDTVGVLPVVNRLLIGAEVAGINILCGTIRKVSYYPVRIQNNQLQALTS
jgi:uncharacterized protein (UPF0333 family)